MNKPLLYQQYDRDQAIALFGDQSRAQSLCDGQWLIFPGVVLCLTAIGIAPKMSHFTSGAGFCWVADKPYEVHDGRHSRFLPAEVIGSEAKGRSIRLFVRPQNSERLFDVGALEPSYRQR